MTLTYNKLQEAYDKVSCGSLEPNMMYVTPKAYDYIKKKYRQQWEHEHDEFSDWIKQVHEENKKCPI